MTKTCACLFSINSLPQIIITLLILWLSHKTTVSIRSSGLYDLENSRNTKRDTDAVSMMVTFPKPHSAKVSFRKSSSHFFVFSHFCYLNNLTPLTV